MADSNPYRKILIPKWYYHEDGKPNVKRFEKSMRFCLHVKNKFEKCYQREYLRKKKLQKIIAEALELMEEIKYMNGVQQWAVDEFEEIKKILEKVVD